MKNLTGVGVFIDEGAKYFNFAYENAIFSLHASL
jgi:hypothetical protein